MEKASKPIAEQEARIRMEIEQSVIEFKKTGVIDSETAGRIGQGKYLYDQYKEGPLPPELALQRYYYTHYVGELKKAALSAAPIEQRIISRQPTKAQKMSVAGEIMNNR